MFNNVTSFVDISPYVNFEETSALMRKYAENVIINVEE